MVATPTGGKLRLQKLLAEVGLCSRRAAEAWILAGRVSVNGEVVAKMGVLVDPEADEVRVDGRPIGRAEAAKLHLAIYKPVWMVTSWSDPQGRPTVRDIVQDLATRLFPVGRLDFDAEGLLFLTNDGALAYQLTHPKFQVRRTYLVKVRGALAPQTLETLRAGVDLSDGPVRPLEVEPVPHPAATAEGDAWLRIALAEGRNHLVKRIFESVGHPVQRLVRAEVGGVTLGRLRPGGRRPLEPQELARLQAAGRLVGPPPSPYPGALEIPPSPFNAPVARRVRSALTPRPRRG